MFENPTKHVSLHVEVSEVRITRGKWIQVHFVDGDLYQTVELRMTKDGVPQVFADNLTPIPWDEWHDFPDK